MTDHEDTAKLTENVRSLLDKHRLRVHRKARAQYLAAKRMATMNTRFGIPVVVFSTIVGTATFASLGSSPDTLIVIATGVVSVAAGVLAALQTFLRFSERAEMHRQAANLYSDLKRKMDVALIEIDASESSAKAIEQTNGLLEILADIDKKFVEAPDRYYDQAKSEQLLDSEAI